MATMHCLFVKLIRGGTYSTDIYDKDTVLRERACNKQLPLKFSRVILSNVVCS